MRGRPQSGGAWVLVPVKALSGAKRRLAPALSTDQRARLQLAMLADVLAAAGEARGIAGIAVVTADPQVAEMARHRGARVIEEGASAGLNAAVAAGVAALARMGADTVVVVAADLPLAVAEDIALTAARATDAGVTVAVPDRARKGTNALAFPAAAPPRFAFGTDSLLAHTAGPGAIALPLASLALDIDTPADLTVLATCDDAGRHTSAMLPELARLLAIHSAREIPA